MPNIGLRGCSSQNCLFSLVRYTFLLAGCELLKGHPGFSSAEGSGSGCCGCGRVCWAPSSLCLCQRCPQSLGVSGRQGVAVWEQKERSAFSEKAVEMPLVPLQSYRVRREERFSTEVPTNPSWVGMSTAMTKRANRSWKPSWSQGDAPAAEAEHVHSRGREEPLTPSTLFLRGFGEREGGHDAEKIGTNSITLEFVQTFCHGTLIWGKLIETPLFATSPDVCRCSPATQGPQCRVSPWLRD